MAEHRSGCLLCGGELRYAATASTRTCALCGAAAVSEVACAAGHYVCDACHGASAMDLIERACAASGARDPFEIAIALMRSPAVKMHGPEHHFLVPAVLLTAYDNATGRPELKAGHLAEARRRAERVPGGYCGSHGTCGAAVGTGIFLSVLTGATPLSTFEWRQCNRLTALCLLRIADAGGPRCCKRDTFLALRTAVEEIAAARGVRLPAPEAVRCEFLALNAQCLAEACPFFSGAD